MKGQCWEQQGCWAPVLWFAVGWWQGVGVLLPGAKKPAIASPCSQPPSHLTEPPKSTSCTGAKTEGMGGRRSLLPHVTGHSVRPLGAENRVQRLHQITADHRKSLLRAGVAPDYHSPPALHPGWSLGQLGSPPGKSLVRAAKRTSIIHCSLGSGSQDTAE